MLSAQIAKLYHAGFREPVRRATLADVNEARAWRIYAEFAHRLIAQARRLYAGAAWDRNWPARLCSGLGCGKYRTKNRIERLRGNLREGFSDVHMLQIRTDPLLLAVWRGLRELGRGALP